MNSIVNIHDALADAIETQLAAYSITVTDSYPRWGDGGATLPTAALVIGSADFESLRTGSKRFVALQFVLVIFGETEHQLEGMLQALLEWLRAATITVDGADYVVRTATAPTRHDNQLDIEAEDHGFDFILQINGVT